MPDDQRLLRGIDRLIVDGTNFVYALRRTATPLPAVALIGRLRAVVPPAVAVTVVLDGSPEPGLVSRHVAAGVEVRYAGRSSADDLIRRLVAEPEVLAAPQPSPSHLSWGRLPADRSAAALVVTDDIELADSIRRLGGRTIGNSWLASRLERQRLSAPSPGRPSPPPSPSAGRSPGLGPGADSGDPDAARWSPGRHATRKRGNPRRRPSSGR